MERQITVAVIDGNGETRQRLIRRLQRTTGISVVGEAGEPGEALRVVRDQRPEVIVIDLRRFDHNGARFLGKIVSTVPRSAIVILTAYLAEGERSDLMRAGARAILFKEIDSERLVQTIRRVAARVVTDKRKSKN